MDAKANTIHTVSDVEVWNLIEFLANNELYESKEWGERKYCLAKWWTWKLVKDNLDFKKTLKDCGTGIIICIL